MMAVMQENIKGLIVRGQNDGLYSKLMGPETLTTIIMGSMRMVVLKWKLSGNKSDLVNDGKSVLNGLLKMLEK